MMIKTVYEQFILSGSSHWSPGTVVYYERNLQYFFRYLEYKKYPMDTDFSELPLTILVEYVVWLRARRRYADHPLRDRMNVDGKIKCNTVNSYMRAVKAFCNFAYASGYSPVEFTRGLRLPRPDSDQIVPLLASEVLAIDGVFDRLVPLDLRDLCILHLMLDAGLRSCEVLSLRAGCIVFSSRTIVVNQGKGNKSRVVIMCPKLESLLREYFTVFHPSGILFRKSTDGRPITVAVIRSLFLRIIRNTGLDRLHPHLLRHTFATSYIMGGGNLETLRILLGHFDYTVTRTYLHLAAQYQILGSDIYRLDPVFFKSGY